MVKPEFSDYTAEMFLASFARVYDAAVNGLTTKGKIVMFARHKARFYGKHIGKEERIHLRPKYVMVRV